MDNNQRFLTLNEVAERLGVEPRKVRTMAREGLLPRATREDGTQVIPEVFLIEQADGTLGVLTDLRGIVTLLQDGGFSEDAAVRWLISENSSLGMTPISALRSGKGRNVRQWAALEAF